MNMRIRLFLELVGVYIVPLVFFLAGAIPIGWRLGVFQLFILFILFLARRRGLSWRALGFRLDTFWPAVRLLLPGVVIALGLIIVLYWQGYGTTYFFNEWWVNVFFLYYLFLGAPSQEFAYRGYLHTRLRSFTSNPWVLVMLNAVLFALLHALHHDVLITAGTFIMGAYLTWVWIRKPSVLASSLAHGIVGATAIVLGFF